MKNVQAQRAHDLSNWTKNQHLSLSAVAVVCPQKIKDAGEIAQGPTALRTSEATGDVFAEIIARQEQRDPHGSRAEKVDVQECDDSSNFGDRAVCEGYILNSTPRQWSKSSTQLRRLAGQENQNHSKPGRARSKMKQKSKQPMSFMLVIRRISPTTNIRTRKAGLQ